MLTQSDVLAQIKGLTVTRLDYCIRETWILPHRDDDGLRFDEVDLARLQLIVDLTEDMAVNDDAVPIILSLVDQLHRLRHHVRALDRAVTEQDDAVVKAIGKRLAALIHEEGQGIDQT